MTRRDRIVVLLEHYQDVIEGIYDTDFSARSACSAPCGDPICAAHGCANEGILALMCRSWNHPSFRELERLRLRLRDEERGLYWHLAETYFRARRKRVAFCPKCERTAPPSHIGELCNHGRPHQPTKTLVPKSVKVVAAAVEPSLVEAAIDWFDRSWPDDDTCFIPADLMGAAAA